MNEEKWLFGFLFSVIILFLIWRSSATEPLFKMRCKECNKKDRNWETVAVSHDDFAWKHKCSK